MPSKHIALPCRIASSPVLAAGTSGRTTFTAELQAESLAGLTQFPKIQAYGKMGALIAKYCHVGSYLWIEGRKEGVEATQTLITAERIVFLGEQRQR